MVHIGFQWTVPPILHCTVLYDGMVISNDSIDIGVHPLEFLCRLWTRWTFPSGQSILMANLDMSVMSLLWCAVLPNSACCLNWGS